MEQEREIIPRKRVLTPRMTEDGKPIVPPKKTHATVIYRPEYGDPPETRCFITENDLEGMLFRANIPVEMSYSDKIEQLLVEKFDAEDGVRSRAIERRVPKIEVLRGNPSFEIDGVKPERIKPHGRLPDTSDAYRGYCINWIALSMSATDMDKRWAGEEGLRQRCGCSPSDIAYLRPFFDGRRMECAALDQQRHVA